jgi:hypothetical protein
LIQHDSIREALLLMYAVMAHQYTRGTWTAPETRPVFNDNPAAPYCTPAQLVVALMTRWSLVFEDPMSETLWLGKAVPREWLKDGKNISIAAAPTQWGKVGFSVTSSLSQGKIGGPVALGEDRMVLVKVTGHHKAEVKPLTQVRDEIVAAILEEPPRPSTAEA